MAQVSMLDTFQNPTQSICQRYIKTDYTAHYVGPKAIRIQLIFRYERLLKGNTNVTQVVMGYNIIYEQANLRAI